MNFRKILSIFVAAVMAATLLSACENETKNEENGAAPAVSGDQNAPATLPEEQSEEEEPTGLLYIDGEEVDTDGLVMMTLDGIDIPFDEYRYIYKYVDYAYFGAGDMNYWAANSEQFPYLLGYTTDMLLEDNWGLIMAEQNGVTLTDEDLEEIETHMQEQRDSFESEEDFRNAMESSNITEDLLRRIITQQVTCNRVYMDLYAGENATKVPSDEEMKKTISEDYVRVYHILIANEHFAEDEEYADASEEELKAAAKEYAEELLERVKNGEDIYELAQSEGDDPGMMDNTEGYLFTEGTMVDEFETAAMSLEVGEISDLVETDYGYHIIQRVEQDQYVEDNWDAIRAEFINNLFNSDVNDLIMNAEIEYWEDYDKLTYESIR